MQRVRCERNYYRSNQVPREHARGQRRRTVDIVCICEVVVQGQEAQVDADAERDARERGNDPVDVRSSSPALNAPRH